ncbi:hypothetical protein PPYR_06726 [Photinus pyralis]|uniref:Secreted protein n=1 Tax=Photinus pyralis TaxID=7054 RepID=A0A5N4ANG6_PHOPY|nr:hypothetical protein PPYR_06726 [Photinus pyralis]
MSIRALKCKHRVICCVTVTFLLLYCHSVAIAKDEIPTSGDLDNTMRPDVIHQHRLIIPACPEGQERVKNKCRKMYTYVTHNAFWMLLLNGQISFGCLQRD